MDVSDIFLAVSLRSHFITTELMQQLSKCVNYVNESASAPIFAGFVVVRLPPQRLKYKS
jgi:hypothetical protein